MLPLHAEVAGAWVLQDGMAVFFAKVHERPFAVLGHLRDKCLYHHAGPFQQCFKSGLVIASNLRICDPGFVSASGNCWLDHCFGPTMIPNDSFKATSSAL